MFKILKNQKGMTLVELLAVMVIVGIIAAISIPAIGGLIENSRKDAAVSTANSMVEAARMYVAAEGLTDGDYVLTANGPAAAKADSEPEVTADLVVTGYLESAPTNPQTKNAYGVAQVGVSISNSKATYTVTLKESADIVGKYGIEAKKSTELNRGNVGS